VRYIAPFRLMFVLCLLSFFVFHLAIDQFAARIAVDDRPVVTVTGDTFKDADTPKEVRKVLKSQLQTLPHIAAYGVLPQHQLELAAENMRQQANKRLAELGAAPMPAASVAANLQAVTRDSETTEPDSGQVHNSWLPEIANDRLARQGHQIHVNWRTFKDGDPAARADAKQRMINGVFGTLPATMFVLIPVFAGLLKLFYVFRRRLYMEHLIVALHSHAFMFLGLLLITLTGMLSTWLRPHAAWTGTALGWVQAALILWIPAYLLLMQKRMYHQGWPMTVLKFWFIGWFYFWLLMFALTVAAALGMAH
jgi:hypothetical protein